MRIGLFIPCYIDQFYPHVGVATLELLERLDCQVVYPLDQTCCGQPMANAGFEHESEGAMRQFVENFGDCEAVVAPSGSCVLFVRDHYHRIEQTEQVKNVRAHTYELCEFLTDVLKIDQLDAWFDHKVGLHASCHGLRGLRLGSSSERNDPHFSKVGSLLKMVGGLELVELDRADECCGFGGTFAVTEEAISVKMGRDRIADHIRNGAEVIAATDMSCLMHMEGLIRRQKLPLRVKHVAEILNARSN